MHDTQARVNQKGGNLTVTTRQWRRESNSSPSSWTLLWLTLLDNIHVRTWPSAPGLKLLDVPAQELIQPNITGQQENSQMNCSARSGTSESSSQDPRNGSSWYKTESGTVRLTDNYWQHWTTSPKPGAYWPSHRATQGTSREFLHTHCITHGIAIRSRKDRHHS